MSAASTAMPVLAVTGMAKEAQLAARTGVVPIGAGGNPERLRSLLAGLDASAYSAVVSIGIAGGLDPGLVPGDVVIASEIVASERSFTVDKTIAATLAARLDTPGIRVVSADLAGVEAAVMSCEAKTALRALTGAAAVDMESHVAADFAERHRLPFAALRVVCDPAERALPAFAATALKPNGEPDILAVLGALIRGRANIGELVRLARDSSVAFASLARCCDRLGPELGIPQR